MTAHVPDAEWLAPIVASLGRIETSLRIAVEVIGRLREDVVGIDRCMEQFRDELQQVRDAVEGRS